VPISVGRDLRGRSKTQQPQQQKKKQEQSPAPVKPMTSQSVAVSSTAIVSWFGWCAHLLHDGISFESSSFRAVSMICVSVQRPETSYFVVSLPNILVSMFDASVSRYRTRDGNSSRRSSCTRRPTGLRTVLPVVVAQSE